MRWINEREWVTATFAIDREIGIERQHGVSLVDLGHPHDARIGERHRSVAIFLMQLEQGGDMLLDAKSDAERTIFEQSEQCILRSREARSRCIASANTGSHTSSGGSNSSTCSTTQR